MSAKHKMQSLRQPERNEMTNEKPACQSCGNTEYEGELTSCPYCDSDKCSRCDMGDDVACVMCEGEDGF